MRSLSIFLTICLFTACSGGENTAEKTENLYNQALIKAQGAEQTENELFLGFKFGMTEAEVMKHMKKLLQEGKVYVNDNSKYQYDLNHSMGLKLYVNFRPQYHEGKLYEIIYPVHNSVISTDGDYAYAAGAFINSERYSGFSTFITKDAMGEPIYSCIKENLIITFQDSGGPEMRYSNAPIGKIVKAAEEREKREKAKESYSDF